MPTNLEVQAPAAGLHDIVDGMSVEGGHMWEGTDEVDIVSEGIEVEIVFSLFEEVEFLDGGIDENASIDG